MDELELTDKFLSQIGINNQPMTQYSLGEKIAYVSMIASLAWADGSIDEKELATITAICKRANIDDPKIINAIIANTEKYDSNKYSRWTELVKNTDLKYSLMADMFYTAFANNVVHDSESVYMKYIAGKLDISNEIYEKIRTTIEKEKGDNIEYEKVFYYTPPTPTQDMSAGFLSKGLKSMAQAVNSFF